GETEQAQAAPVPDPAPSALCSCSCSFSPRNPAGIPAGITRRSVWYQCSHPEDDMNSTVKKNASRAGRVAAKAGRAALKAGAVAAVVAGQRELKRAVSTEKRKAV